MTKTFCLNTDGSIHKEAVCFLKEGTARKVLIAGLQDLSTTIIGLQPNEALCYGLAEKDLVSVVAQDNLANHPGAIARDRGHFRFNSGPGIFMLDYDPQGTPKHPTEVINTLRKALPEAENVSLLWRPSASSCIYNLETNQELTGIRGIRIWMAVSDATKIPDLGKILVTRLWANGEGHFIISKSGQLLKRQSFDQAVWQPERIDFAAGASCQYPLEQRLPMPTLVHGSDAVLDLQSLPKLTERQWKVASKHDASARHKLCSEARMIRDRYLAERSTVIASKQGLDEKCAQSILRAAVDRFELTPEFILLSSEYGEVSVSEVLADKNKYDGGRFADPLEPDYRDDHRVAFANLTADDPYIYSHAHGGTRYRLLTPGQVIDDPIDLMNEQFAVIPIGKNCFISDENIDPATGLRRVSFLTRQAFDLLMMNRLPTDDSFSHLGSQWLAHERRKEYEGVEFNPCGSTHRYLNLFRGFPIKPQPGSTERWWHFVKEVICQGNLEAYQYVRRWLAHIFQRPAELPGTALVLRGRQGSGKNTFADTIGCLLGQHYVEVHTMEQVTGRFTGHLKHAIVVHANEAIWGGSKQQQGTLKGMITDPMVTIEQKGIDQLQIRNYRRLIVSSNEVWAVPADLDDRRFVFLNVSAARCNDRIYFDALYEELKSGGYAAILHDLLQEDLSGFVPQNRPNTGYGFDIKLRSAEPIIRWLHDVLDNGGFTSVSCGQRDWPKLVEKQHFYEAYRTYFFNSESRKPESEAEFHKQLKAILPSIKETRPRKKYSNRPPGLSTVTSIGRRPRSYKLPSIRKARDEFEQHMRCQGAIPWAKYTPGSGR